MTRILLNREEDSTGITRQARARITVDTLGAGPTDVTPAIEAWLESLALGDGVVHVFLRHTSASLTIQENADPDVLEDLFETLDRLAPTNVPYRHGSEGPDDMPAHIKGMLTDVALTIPVTKGRLDLGTWQAIYLMEHRIRPRRREIALTYVGT